MTVYLHSLGCDKNLVDSELMLGLLFEDGYRAEGDPAQADMIVVNTCGFIQEAVEEGIAVILEMAEYKKSGLCTSLVVTGCMAQRYRDEIMKEIPEVDKILGVNDFPKITGKNLDIMDEELYAKRAHTMPMHVAYVKISEGCDNHCSYCTIPAIRGAYRDRDFESIVAECSRLLKGGAKELVLIAQDTARYGTKTYGRQRLHELLEAISALDFPCWIRIMYAYPEHIYPQLIDTIAGNEKICNYIDMPIQHSHNDVIARMGRGSSSESLRSLAALLREKGIAIRTTLIAGFPGETEEEFEHLLSFVQDMRFDHLGVFTYSREDGTPAAKMKPQITASVKKARQDKLMSLQAKIAAENSSALVGQTLLVMVDGSVGSEGQNIHYSARSRRDAYDIDGAVFFSSREEWMSGDMLMVKVKKSAGYDLYGEVVQKEEETPELERTVKG